MTVQSESAAPEALHYCTVHTNIEATLRCNRCDRYMCIQCAVQTPVGYRCRECIRGLEDKVFNASQADYVIIFAVCAVLGAVTGYVMWQVRFLIVALVLGFPVGGMISEAARRTTNKRRGRYTAHAAAAGTALGTLTPLLLVFLQYGVLVPNLSQLLFAGLATAAVWARFAIWK